MKTKCRIDRRVRRRVPVRRSCVKRWLDAQPQVVVSPSRSSDDGLTDLYGQIRDPKDLALIEAWSC